MHRQWTIRTAVAAVCFAATLAAQASSHREAPFITEQPKVDATDFYMFRSYEPGREGYITLIANYVPLQSPYAGPNYFTLDPDALYEIHVDNDGDGVENLTFQFEFNQHQRNIALNVGGKNVAIPLVQAGPITSVRPAVQNVYETFTVELVSGPRRGTDVRHLTNPATGSGRFDKPIDNIGNKTLPDYSAYAAKFVHAVNIPGCGQGRVFVGQRKDSFAVNLGETFDLINIQAPATEFDPNAERAEPDSLADANVTTMAVEVPIRCLTSGAEPVLGAWTTASLRKSRMLQTVPTSLGGTPPSVSWETGSLGAGLATGHAVGKRSGHRPEGQGSLQCEPACAGRAIRVVRDESDIAGPGRSVVRHGGRARTDELSPHRPGVRVPDRCAGSQQTRQRQASGDVASQHDDPGDRSGLAATPRRACGRCRRISERSPAW